MTDPVKEAHDAMLAVPYAEGAPSTEAAIDRYVSAYMQQSQRTTGTRVGMFTIATPPDPVSEPGPEPVTLALGADFAPHAEALGHAQTVADREGFDGLPALLVMLDQTPPHERTVALADIATREAAAEATMTALRARHGLDRAEEIADAARAAVQRLGLAKLITEFRQENHADIIEYLGTRWLNRSRKVA